MRKTTASLSLDLDNQWSYMKTHGDPGWESFPSYLDIAVPRILEILERHELKITFFVVGQDAILDKNKAALSQIAEAGHEIGNHSFHHEPWLHLYSPEQVNAEIAEAECAIEAATGVKPKGFRGPGFSLSAPVLDVLKGRGYRYDASTFPTYLGPIARAYYFFKAKFPEEEREKRRNLFGGMRDGMRPLRPYIWTLDRGGLLEIPVTTIPFFRVPFHLSYVLYLAAYSPAIARWYFSLAIRLCRFARVEPSLLLHPLDFLGADDVDGLDFFPSMHLAAKEKLLIVEWALATYSRHFQVCPMGRHADALLTSGRLRSALPDFPIR